MCAIGSKKKTREDSHNSYPRLFYISRTLGEWGGKVERVKRRVQEPKEEKGDKKGFGIIKLETTPSDSPSSAHLTAPHPPCYESHV